MTELHQITMPAHVFVDSVRSASLPCDGQQTDHPAVRLIAEWWNATAAPEHQSAYGFSLYVRAGEGWLSGNPEEHYVDAATWARVAGPQVKAVLLGESIVMLFNQRVCAESPHHFESKGVDGSGGMSGGKGPGEASGNAILVRYAHEALSLFPARFPEAWRQVLMRAELEAAAG
ncbi:hypothetical protein L4Z68_001398 [Pseudomonas aeruginosa]|nr:hypothetical protein [Pseudomonas aeruginosa]EKX2969405.1 hypothetical protein [Pseudomonas aeruginosa]HBO8004226.1 hypothetical protein [Pseudomonas aeruginosa]